MSTFVVVLGVGLGFGAAVYMLLSKVRRIWLLGIILLTTVTNGLLFLLSRPLRSRPAFAGLKNTADPIPQALILTAIVIGLALLVAAILSTRQEERS